MSSGPDPTFLKNDLRAVSAFIVVVFVIVVVMEGTHTSVPESYGQTPTTPSNNPPPEPVLVTETVVSKTGYTSEGQSSEEKFGLPDVVITKVHVELTWADDIGNNDQFSVTLLNEGTEVGTAEGSTGSLSFDVNPADNETFSGNFTITVQAINCPGLVGPLPIDRDSGNSWDLEVAATYIEEDG